MEKEIDYRIFIGNYTKEGVTILDTKRMISKCTKQGKIINNSYICKYKDYLYSVAEVRDESTKSGYISSYRVSDNTLEFINSQSSYGYDPCFIIVNELFGLLFVANYTGGSFSIFKICKDGSIGNLVHNTCYGKDSRIHQIKFSNDFTRFYVVDLGLDKIIAYSIQSKDDQFVIRELSKLELNKGENPRHMEVNNDDSIILITEQTCDLIMIHVDKDAVMRIVDRKSILPKRNKENCTGCAIKIDRINQFIYTSIRGDNSISVFKILPKLELVQNISCNGICPRDIFLTSDKEFLICANQISNNLSFFSIKNGRLLFEKCFDTNKPTCICI